MTEPYLRKLATFAVLTDDDLRAFAAVVGEPYVVAEGEIIVARGETPSVCHILVDGLVCCHRSLSEETRQILAFQIAGDIVDLHGLLIGRMDFEVGTVTSCRIAKIRHEALTELLESRPAVSLAIWRQCLIDHAVARQWLVNLGHSQARQRIAHLFCEFAHRLDAVHLGRANRYRIPLTQQAIADATGMSSVHVNRVLQTLRKEGLITFQGGDLAILSVDGMRDVADFDSAYLHLEDQPPERPAA